MGRVLSDKVGFLVKTPHSLDTQSNRSIHFRGTGHALSTSIKSQWEIFPIHFVQKSGSQPSCDWRKLTRLIFLLSHGAALLQNQTSFNLGLLTSQLDALLKSFYPEACERISHHRSTKIVYI